ncbi:MAG: redoxin, partial [Frankiales bacterium]|nr:redoxin [Frankiales bacterium]
MRARHSAVPSRPSGITTGGASALLLLVAACGGPAAEHTAITGPDASTTSSSQPSTAATTGSTTSSSSGKPAPGTSAAPKASSSASTAGTSPTSGATASSRGGGHNTGPTASASAAGQQVSNASIVVDSRCRKPASSVGSGVAVKGSKPPPFTATTVDCKAFDFTAFTKGKPTIVNFYASWCEPCHKEAKDLESVYKEWNAKNGLEVVGIETQDEDGNASWFYKSAGYTF